MLHSTDLTELFHACTRLERRILQAANAMTETQAAELLKTMVLAERIALAALHVHVHVPAEAEPVVITANQAEGMDSTLTFNYQEPS